MFDFFKKKKNDEKSKVDSSMVSLGANAQNLNRGSEAARQHVVAYSGHDGVSGKDFQQSLSKLGNGLNVEAKKGYTAEVMDVAKRNAENILDGNDIRFSRVDDLPGHKVNETPFDIMAIAPDGTEIIELGSQMKFNNALPEDVVDILMSKKFRQKYPHAQYSVPGDRFDKIKVAMEDKERNLSEQLKKAKELGDVERVTSLEERLGFLRKAKKNLVKSKVELAEAKEAVLHPQTTTLKNMAEVGHDTGVKYAKSAMQITGALTFARCVSKTMKGEMTPRDAAREVAYETAKSGGTGYITGQANTMLASVMSNSSKEFIRKLGSSSAPAQIIAFSTSVFKIINDRNAGKMTDEECFNEIAKSGIGVVGTFNAGVVGEVAGAKIGEALGFACGGPVGAIVASLVAGMIINSTYDYAVYTLKSPGIAKQERIEIEEYCKVLNAELENYRTEFRNTYVKYTYELTNVFGESLKTMAVALQMNDADLFVGGANAITHALGGTTQFNNFNEFQTFLSSDEVFDL